MATNKTLLTWLNDAYAMEEVLVEVLEKRVDQTKNHPDVQKRIKEHLEETKRHGDMVKESITRLDGSVSPVKSAVANISGFMQGMASGLPHDALVKNSIADYAAEHFEIASYHALMTAAEELGDKETANMCAEILEDEEAMAEWLMEQHPIAVKECIGQTEEEE